VAGSVDEGTDGVGFALSELAGDVPGALLAEAPVRELRDHRQLPFRHRRLHPSQIRHHVDQLRGRQ